LFLYSNHNLEC